MYLTDKDQGPTSPIRQADANLIAELEAEAKALSLRGAEGIADFVRHSVENAARVLAAGNLNVLDRYRKGEVAAYLRFHISGTDRQFDLSFRSIPSCPENGRIPDHDGRTVRLLELDGRTEGDKGGANLQGDESAVFLGISNLVEGPEGVIPSLVSLEFLENRTDFRWQIFASASQIVPPVFFIGPEGEFNRLEAWTVGGDGRSIPGLVQNGAQVVGGIKQDTGKHLRQIANDLNFVNVLSGIRIFINDSGPWIAIDKSANRGFELVDVVFCTTESQSSTIKYVGHDDKTRSDQEPRISKGGAAFSHYATKAAQASRQAHQEETPREACRFRQVKKCLARCFSVSGVVRYPVRQPLALDTFKRNGCTFPVFDLASVPFEIPFGQIARKVRFTDRMVRAIAIGIYASCCEPTAEQANAIRQAGFATDTERQ